ncbi:MAG TPA: polyprenyl diphosphate synthase, partial [Phycisphaerae bacterium]|nr:polyprenyl diphosphate synthase [Phycisphaerae bacterium]
PDDVLREMDTTIAASAGNTGMRLCLALNYGARTELVDAIRRLASEAAAGIRDAGSIEESDVGGALYTAGLPDPDLLIRTAGERRISNFLLWQMSYAELYICDACWPDFGIGHLHAAIQDYAGRDRRFGGLTVGQP